MNADQVSGVQGRDEAYQTIVVGGGQAGLAAGYYLAKQGADFLILDQHPRTGDAWRCRWESLRLFTPSQFDNLPGMPFPKPPNSFPTRDEAADYLEAYAQKFNLPVRHNVRVEHLRRAGDGYEITAGADRYTAQNVIIATGPFQRPFTPGFSSLLGADIFQLHTNDYKNPGQVPAQSVLVVGAGNSGAEIALELAKAGKQVWLAGRDVGILPVNTSPLGKILDGRILWWLMTHLLTVKTPMGRKMQAKTLHSGAPLGRATRQELAAAGVKLAPRMAGVQSGKPQLEDGSVLPVDGVIWATGYRPDYRWVDLPVLDEQGYPLQTRGVARNMPGLYFLGLLFQYGLSSSLLGGVGKDAGYIVEQISRERGEAENRSQHVGQAG